MSYIDAFRPWSRVSSGELELCIDFHFVHRLNCTRIGIVHRLNKCVNCNNFLSEFQLNRAMSIFCLSDVYVVLLSPDETLEQGRNASR